MMPTKPLMVASLALAVLAAGCMGTDNESTGEPGSSDDAFDNDSMYGGDAGVTPGETGMDNQTNETNETADLDETNESAG